MPAKGAEAEEVQRAAVDAAVSSEPISADVFEGIKGLLRGRRPMM